MDAPMNRQAAMDYLSQLPLNERLIFIAEVLEVASQEASQEQVKPRRSLKGLLADLGPAPSAEDIDEARREMWGNFPREDF